MFSSGRWHGQHLKRCKSFTYLGMLFHEDGKIRHDAIGIAHNGCSYGWAAQVFKCFAKHGKSSPLVAGAPVEVQPDELQLSFQMQRQAAFDAVPLDPRSCQWPGGEAVHVSPLVFSFCTSGLPSLLGSPHEHCKFAEDFEILHGVSFAAD